MPQIIRLALVAGFMLVLPACAGHGEPSDEAKKIPGAKGTIVFKPEDRKPWTWRSSWWKDSDGIDPGVAGCHIGTDKNGTPNGRMFGEACLPNGLLVESNPGKDELHKHRWDIGHPDTFDCSEWCRGREKENGVCVATPAPPCATSAMCACE